MRSIEIKITGSGTLDQVAGRLLDIVRDLQYANAFNTETPKGSEDSILCAEISEE